MLIHGHEDCLDVAIHIVASSQWLPELQHRMHQQTSVYGYEKTSQQLLGYLFMTYYVTKLFHGR